ncbi:MAG: AmmeMemoRadiSam system protein B [Bacteroidales bacterium]
MKTASDTRKAGAAGMFYPVTASEIRTQLGREAQNVREAMDKRSPEGLILGGVLPHAGMDYCAHHAVHFFELLRRSGQKPDTVVIAHPSHSGVGPPVSVDGHHSWETPLGLVGVDLALSEASMLPVSSRAQLREHSSEVIVPYLQYFLDEGFRILSVNMLQQNREVAQEVAEKIYRGAHQLGRKLLFLASSDFSHFLSPQESAPLDDKVLAEILEKNPRGVEEMVHQYRVSVCGYGPVMALMEYAALTDPAYHVRLLSRGHSGEVIPSGKVVNYMSLLFSSDKGL